MNEGGSGIARLSSSTVCKVRPELTRADNAFYGGFNMTLLDRLTGDLFYRFRVQEYLQTSRTDLDHLVSLTVTYAVTRYISHELRGYFMTNDSNGNLV